MKADKAGQRKLSLQVAHSDLGAMGYVTENLIID